MELNYKAIGKRIKIARIQADLTQERLAEISDISVSHMSNIETGTTRISLTTLVAIANALHVTTDDFLCDNVVQCKVQFQKEIAELLDSCDEHEIRIAKDMLATLISSLRRDDKFRKQLPPKI
ncbi:MAG: helix-turn-helix transcriptional regulator [Eubacteriales bacterium]|nr:helix-turn-helix transcriptional regulator [Eubacteriales bacterium]